MEDYRPTYTSSWALVIGINVYRSAHRLQYAVNDAETVSEKLTSRFNFPTENVIILKDDQATRNNIVTSFFRLKDLTQPNDRVIFYFAGHGHTYAGRRSDVGFLVPVDGNPKELGTLLRWDELTRDADFIPAKHIGAGLIRFITSNANKTIADTVPGWINYSS